MFSDDIKAPEDKNPCNYCLQGGTKAALKGLQLLQSSTKKETQERPCKDIHGRASSGCRHQNLIL